MTPYKVITALKLTEDWSKRMQELSLNEGWDILAEDFEDSEERKKVVLFCVYAYDPDSKKLRNWSARLKDKADIARSLNLPPLIADGLINNEYDSANKFISYYYRIIKDMDASIIFSFEEMIEFHLEVIRKKSSMPKILGVPDEETFLKNQIHKSKLAESCDELKIRLDRLKKEYETKFNQTDKAIREEVEDEKWKNSGRAERSAEKYKDDLK